MGKTQKFGQENAKGRKVGGPDEVCTSLPPPQRAPWLVFFSHGKSQKLQTIVSLSEERVYELEQEEMSRSYYYACCGGWLFMTDLSHRCCFLLNLLSMKKIMLPPPPRGSNWISDTVIISSRLPKGGSSSSNMILCYRRDKNVFLFHNFEEDKWGMVKSTCKCVIQSLLTCNGTIYALAGSCLAVVDVVPKPKVRILPIEAPPSAMGVSFYTQLLESCGEVFFIRRYDVLYTKRVYSFEVHRMDFSEMKWVKVSNLGDRAFFLGVSSASPWGPGMSCSASRAGIAGNCIYFVDSNYSSILKYDMADESVTTEMSWPSVPQPWAEVAWINIFKS